ncbi:MAG: hypothetical protein AB7E45_08130 [Candidatus Caldatribacteriota bacterium]
MEAEVLIKQMPAKVLKAYEIWTKTHSNKKTAELIGVSERTISVWKKKYRWEDIERETLARIIDEANDKVSKIKEDQRKIVTAAIASAIKQLKEGKIKARSFSDLVTLLKYQLELEGEFKQDVNVNVSLSLASLHEELERRRREAWEGMKAE